MKKYQKSNIKNQISNKLRKGDEVKVVAGKDRGKTGKVESIFPKDGKVLITGINQYKRHLKARAQGQKSEIVTITKPLPVANVAPICPKCHLPTRMGMLYQGNEKKRICRKCEAVI